MTGRGHYRTGALASLLALGLLALPACEQEEPQLGVRDTGGGAGVVEPLGVDEQATPRTALAEDQAAAGEGQVLAMPIGSGNGAVEIRRTGATEIRVGQAYDYQIVVTNTSEHPLHDVRVVEFIPENFEVSQSQPAFQMTQGGEQPMPQQAQQQQQQPQQQQGQARQNQQRPGQQAQRGQAQQGQGTMGYGGQATWSLGMLMPDESRTIRVTGVARSEGEMQSCLAVDYKPAVCTTVNVIAPELTLERLVVNAEGQPVQQAYVCEELFLVYRLRNTGTGATDPAIITEDLPEGVALEDARDVRVEAGAIAPGEPFETDPIPLVIERPVVIESYAVATTGQLRTQSNAQRVTIVEPQLEVSVSAPQQARLGDPVRFNVTVRNTSDVPAIETMVQVPRPEGVEEWIVEGAQLGEAGDAIALGTLEPGQSKSFVAAVQPTEPTSIDFAARAVAYCAADTDAARAQAAVEVRGIPAVLLEVVDNNDPVAVGDTTIYEINVKNQGSAMDMNVALQAQLPQGMEFVRARGDTRVQAQGGQLQFAPISELPPGEVASWLVEARAVQPDNARFRVELVSDANQRPIIEQEPTTLY